MKKMKMAVRRYWWDALIVVCVVAIGVMATRVAALESEKTQLENAAKAKAAAEKLPEEKGEVVFVTCSERDIVNPERSGLYNRQGFIKNVDLAEALAKLGLSDIATMVDNDESRLVGRTQSGESISLVSSEVEDELDRVFVVSAEVFSSDQTTPLMREQRISLGEDVMYGGEKALAPVVGYYDSELKLFVSDRELDCLKYLLVNPVPEDAKYVEDVLYENTPVD